MNRVAARLARIRRWLRLDNGQDLLEYGILASLIAVAAIGTVSSVGARVAAFWDFVKSGLF